MLQTIRDKSKSWLSVLLISIIILSFALWGIQRLFMSSNTSAPVAKVFSTKINQADLSTEYERLRRQAQISLGSRFFSDATLPEKLKRQALENLVLLTAMRHATDKEGYRVDMTLVGSMIGLMPIFEENGHFSQERFLERVSELGYTQESFFQLAQESLITQQVKSGMIGTSFLLPNEMRQVESQLFQERQFNYLMISPAFFSGQASVSDRDMRAYYQQHQHDFQLPEQMSIEYVELSSAGLSDKNLKEKSAQLSDLNDEHPDYLIDLAKKVGLPIQTT
jgi:peptidyl-prolyl cis-trans isomerase D